MNTLENAIAQAVDLLDRRKTFTSEQEISVSSTLAATELGADGSTPIWASLPDLPCRVQDADLWFAEKPDDLEKAKSFCQDCPVRLTCLAGAIARREPWGVGGGEIFEHGDVVARKRPRGRPRKAVAA